MAPFESTIRGMCVWGHTDAAHMLVHIRGAYSHAHTTAQSLMFIPRNKCVFNECIS